MFTLLLLSLPLLPLPLEPVPLLLLQQLGQVLLPVLGLGLLHKGQERLDDVAHLQPGLVAETDVRDEGFVPRQQLLVETQVAARESVDTSTY